MYKTKEKNKIGNKSKLFNNLILGIFEEFLRPQYYIVARKIDE